MLRKIYHANDVQALNQKLHYVRTKDGRKVDFLISENNKPIEIIDVKNSNRDISKNLKYFKDKLNVKSTQIVRHLRNIYSKDNIRVIKVEEYQSNISTSQKY